jgi:hypothetical protein
MKRQKKYNITHGTKSSLNDLALSNLNTGWGPAVSSVGDKNYKPTNMRSAYKNRDAMIAYFGNSWVNANVKREESELELKRLKTLAFEDYKAEIKTIEQYFLKNTGMKAPTVLKKEAELYLYDLKHNGTLTPEQYAQKKAAVLYKLNIDMYKIPNELIREFEEHVKDAEHYLQKKYKMAENASSKFYLSAKIGTPKLPQVKKTLSNRLRNAKAIGKAYDPSF